MKKSDGIKSAKTDNAILMPSNYAEQDACDDASIEIVFDCLKHETDPSIRKALLKQMNNFFEYKSCGLEAILKTVWQT